MADDKLTAIKGAKILLVEDNEINQLVTKKLLTYLGMKVSIAVNGAEAVRLLANSPQQIFDIVLMDVQMPIMDGREATRKIRELPGPVRNIPIIAVSGEIFVEEIEANLAAGMNAQITKPIEIREIFDVFASFLKEHSIIPTNIDQPEKTAAQVKIEIPGIDTQAGLTRVVGNKDLYEELLATFIASNRNIAEEMYKNSQEEDFSQIEFLAHGIKGTSGSLGAMGLHKAAQLVEESCRNKQLTTKIMRLFDQKLKQTIDAIETYLMRSSTHKLELGEPKSHDRQQFSNKLKILQQQLREFDADALTTLNDIQCKMDIPEPSQFHSIEIAVNNLDFDMATSKLSQYTKVIFNS